MKHFRSKIDFIPVLLLVLAVFLLDTAAMGFAIPAMANVANLAPFALFLIATFVPVLLVLALYPVRYHMSGRELVVRSGLLRWTIPLADLHRACLARDLRPAPALSMDRIRLDYQSGARVRSLYVSPVDPLAFLAALVERDKGLGDDGGDVVRHSGPVLWFDNAAARAS
ncbi:MAG: PH domain-containing protein [bacterium]|nr:PH domain-containing protein [bacterium]